MQTDDFTMVIQHVEEGLERIRAFYRESSGAEAAEQSGEVLSLESGLEEIHAKRPLSLREPLKRALNEAAKQRRL